VGWEPPWLGSSLTDVRPSLKRLHHSAASVVSASWRWTLDARNM
jgi:hypothetical protein